MALPVGVVYITPMTKILFIFFLFSFGAKAAIYGPDNRQLITSQNANYQKARSVAVLIPNSFIESSKNVPGAKNLVTAPLTDSQYMCPTERFASLPSFYVSCTGFLVAPDLLVTAGHCSVSFGEAQNEVNNFCTDFSWYFDFEANEKGDIKTTDIPAENIYECEKIIKGRSQ